MKKAIYFTQELRAIEPTIEIENAWRASFHLGGFRCQASLVADEWLVSTIHFIGDTKALLAMQRGIAGLAKITAGSALRVDVPLDTEVRAGFALARQEMLEALRGISGKPRELAQGADQQALKQQIQEHFAASESDWSADDQGFAARLSVKQLSQKVLVKIADAGVHCYADLLRLREAKEVSRQALGHYLLALNQNLRLARAQLLEEQVRLEVIIPVAAFSLRLFERAMKAISVGVGMAKRECAALLAEDVARAYCDFHTLHLDATCATRTGLTEPVRESQQAGG